jgi:diaminopimelate epimerase
LTAADIPVKSDNKQVIDEKILVNETEYHMTCVSMGNPHSVVFVEDTDKFPLDTVGPLFESHEVFPRRVNAEFVQVVDRHTVKMRVWERGSGETLACGTGACATAVACILNDKTEDEVTVKLLGGDLSIRWNRENNRIYMTGPATVVFDGVTDRF